MSDVIDNTTDCCICYNPIHVKVSLKCKHYFCFNCIKANILKNRHKCPLCNANINYNFLTKVQTNNLRIAVSVVAPPNNPNVYWLYQSKTVNKWWLFDLQFADQIEDLYQQHISGVDVSTQVIQICGFDYNFNFTTMEQINSKNTRTIKRIDSTQYNHMKAQNSIKGIGGVPIAVP